MSIDSTSLSYLSQAISNSSSKKDYLSLSLKNSLQDKVNVISKAASQISTQSRYKAAFEEKMKIANGSADTVSISQESIDALKKYQSSNVKNSDKSDSSSSSGYSYDYQSIKKKRIENIAKIEQEVSLKYAKKTDTSSQTETTNQSDSTKKDLMSSTSSTSDTKNS
ncbi:MAG: hypothetical protein U0O25_07575 [Succinivibrio sp.]|uniref:hypothetical protein n=1 Tax=Succinivibrio sp. TaxID=2053619 RepID=UPI002F9557A7